jgi:hypothetical protein
MCQRMLPQTRHRSVSSKTQLLTTPTCFALAAVPWRQCSGNERRLGVSFRGCGQGELIFQFTAGNRFATVGEAFQLGLKLGTEFLGRASDTEGGVLKPVPSRRHNKPRPPNSRKRTVAGENGGGKSAISWAG